MSDNKKPFDPTICFTFFGSWVGMIERLATQADNSSLAYSLFKAIAYYSMYDVEPDFDNLGEPYSTMLSAAWDVISAQIDNSVQNRAKRFDKEEIPENHKAIIAECIKSPNKSRREMAKDLGTSKSTVNRVRIQYRKEIEEGIQRASISYSNADGAVDEGTVSTMVEEQNSDFEDDLPF